MKTPEQPSELEQDAPLMHLLQRQPHDMDDSELEQSLVELRQLQASAPTRRAAVKKKAAPVKNFDHLFE